jgi:hypothetical protein
MKHAVRHQLSALQRIIDSPGSTQEEIAGARAEIRKLQGDPAPPAAPTFTYTSDLDLVVEAYCKRLSGDLNESRSPIAQKVADDISLAKLGGTPNGVNATATRLLAVFRVTQSDWLRRTSYLSLLSLLYFQALPPELADAIKAIEDEQPEMNDALVDGSGKGFFLCALAG